MNRLSKFKLIEKFKSKRLPSYVKTIGFKIIKKIYDKETDDTYLWANKENLYLQAIYNYKQNYLQITIEENDMGHSVMSLLTSKGNNIFEIEYKGDTNVQEKRKL